MMVISDINDVFVPIPVDKILIHPYDAQQKLLMEKLLIKMYVLGFPPLIMLFLCLVFD
jgi:hypothetical protein